MKLCLLILLALATVEVQCNENNALKAKRVLVKRGARAYLPCGGMSVVKIGDFMTWFRGDEVVATYRVDPDLPTPRKLIIKKVKDEDTGTYRCRVISVYGPPKDHVVERVMAPVNVSIRTDNNVNFEAGSPRVLACVVHGSIPSLNVTWYLGDTMLRPNVYKEVNRGNFTVSSLTFVPSLTDNGKDLVCKATNHLMTDNIEDRVTVSVGHRPQCINEDFRTIGAVQGETETLVCMVESDPEPEQFIWTFSDGRTVYTSSKQKVSGHSTRYSSTLAWVPKDDDYGPLYCRSSNRFGEQKEPCIFSVINGGPPNMPDCDIHWDDHETLSINCDKNWDGGRPQTIHLDVKTPGGTRRLSRKGNELKVNSLHRGENLTLELYATNSRGRSLTLLVTLPPPESGRMPAEQPYITKQAPWVDVLLFILYAILIILVGFCCFGCFYDFFLKLFSCTHPRNDDVEGSFRRGEEMIEFNAAHHDMPDEEVLEMPEPCVLQPPTQVRAMEGRVAYSQYYL